MKQNPTTSIRMVSRKIHIHKSTVESIVHDEWLHPYRVQPIQVLEPGDYDKRIEFVKWYLQESAENPNFAASVLLTVEVVFSLEDMKFLKMSFSFIKYLFFHFNGNVNFTLNLWRCHLRQFNALNI